MTFRYVKYEGEWERIIEFLAKEHYVPYLLSKPLVTKCPKSDSLDVTLWNGDIAHCAPGQYLAIHDMTEQAEQKDGAPLRGFFVFEEKVPVCEPH